MPNRKAKDRKRLRRKLNDTLKKYGRTRKQVQRKIREQKLKDKERGLK